MSKIKLFQIFKDNEKFMIPYLHFLLPAYSPANSHRKAESCGKSSPGAKRELSDHPEFPIPKERGFREPMTFWNHKKWL